MSERLSLKLWVLALALVVSVLAFSFFSSFGILLHAVPITFFSLLTSFLRERVFMPWFKMTIVWLPVSIFGALLNSGSPGFFGASERDYFLLVSLATYAVVSFLLILIQSIRVYWLKK